METRKAVLVGISGCSSSGKTTLARLLRDIFPNSFILHEDDFYKQDKEIPVKDGIEDWDCPEALDVEAMNKALSYIRSTGQFPPDVESKEDQNSVGKCPVSDGKISEVKEKVKNWASEGNSGHAILGDPGLRLCLLDGFLLYDKQLQPTMSLIDIKMFLLVSYEKAKYRREARDGYVTLEGFWKDPPGYVDKIVWPNYVAAHKWLFKDGNVEGQLDASILDECGIRAQVGQGLDIDMESTLEWAVDMIMKELEVLIGAN